MSRKNYRTNLFDLNKLKKAIPEHYEYPNHWKFVKKITSIKGFKSVTVDYMFYKTFDENFVFVDPNSSFSFYDASRNVGDKLSTYLKYEIANFLSSNFSYCLVEHFSEKNIQLKLSYSSLFLISKTSEENPLDNSIHLLTVSTEKLGSSEIYYNNKLKCYIYDSEEFNKMYREFLNPNFDQNTTTIFNKIGKRFFYDNLELLTYGGKIFVMVPYSYESVGVFNLFYNHSSEFCPFLPRYSPRQLVSFKFWTHTKKVKELSNDFSFPFTYGHITFHSKLIFELKENLIADGDIISFDKNGSKHLGVVSNSCYSNESFSYFECPYEFRFDVIHASETSRVDKENKLSFYDKSRLSFFSYNSRRNIILEIKGEIENYYYCSLYPFNSLKNGSLISVRDSFLGKGFVFNKAPILISKENPNLTNLSQEDSDVLLYSLNNEHPKLYLFKELIALSEIGSDYLEFSLPLINLDLMMRDFEDIFKDFLPFLKNKNVMKTPKELSELYRNIFKKSKLLIGFKP